MLLFRSEEHLGRWLRERQIDRGATMSLRQQWQLAVTWYGNKLDPEWRRRSPEEAQQVFEGLGLTGDFWRIT